jgi:glutathione S-transferase
MKLRFSPTSPFVRKVMVTAIEAGIEKRLEPVATVTTDPLSGLTKDNPLGKVPALILDNGESLYDSPVICEYLDSLHGGHKLFPATGPARWTALRRQALSDGLMDAGVLAMVEGRRPEGERSPGWVAMQKAKVARAVAALETEAERLGDPAGPADIGTIAVGVAMGYVEFRKLAEGWRATHPRLAHWFDAFAKRPSMQATLPQDPK